jgi:hypothetical protein
MQCINGCICNAYYSKLERNPARGGPFNRLMIQFEQGDCVDDMLTDLETCSSTLSSRATSSDDVGSATSHSSSSRMESGDDAEYLIACESSADVME